MSNSIDDSLNPVKGTDYLRSIEAIPEAASAEPAVDSGVSSIEKSKTVSATAGPAMNVPILSAPSDQAAFTISTVDATGRPVVQVLMTLLSKAGEITKKQQEGWAQNLREIDEQVRQLLASPLYLQLQEIRMKGDARQGQGAVAGVQGARGAAKVDNPEAMSLISTIERMQVMEKVPPTAEVQDTTPPQEPSRQLMLPLFAVMAIGGALALGAVQATSSGAGVSSNVLSDVVKLIEKLQPIMPQFSVADIVPVINLMLVGPIYVNSWQQAISSFKNNERQNTVEIVHQFAQDVIKMVSNPTSILNMLAAQTSGTKPLPQNILDQRTTLLKLVMVGAALSLLYSVEVGKIHKGQFGGIPPEELRDILLGKVPVREDSKRKPTMQEQLTTSLLKRAWEQINLLPTETDRVQAVNVLLNYLSETREVNHLMDPAKVFQDVFASMTFDVKGQQPDRLKG